MYASLLEISVLQEAMLQLLIRTLTIMAQPVILMIQRLSMATLMSISSIQVSSEYALIFVSPELPSI
jgi:hypothetical protein